MNTVYFLLGFFAGAMTMYGFMKDNNTPDNPGPFNNSKTGPEGTIR